MKLLESQFKFTTMIPALINKAHELGFHVTLGDAFRDPRVHGEYNRKVGYGSAKSQHKRRLAIDLNLFSGDKYLSDTEAHRQLGEWWESVGGTWGGRFKIPDGNHYQWGE